MRRRITSEPWCLGQALVLLLAGAAGAVAADSSYRKELAQRSEKEGLGRPEIPLLERRPAAGRAPAAEELRRHFAASTSPVTTGGTTTRRVHRDSLRLNGRGWFLQVHGDGSRARYRNYGRLDQKKDLARPVGDRIKPEQLESLGRRFVESELKAAVVLGPGEALVPLFTEYQIAGGGPAKDGSQRVEEKVLAATVVFGRTIDGVSVVGPGSKVAVMFANDEQPVGFDYDWPAYQKAGRGQRVLPMPDIRKRADQVASTKLDAPGVEIKRVECGYFDAGSRRRDAKAPVQAACVFQYVQRSIIDAEANRKDPASGHLLAAFVEAIPAGAEVERDGGWVQAARARGEPVKVPGTAPTQARPTPQH